MWRGVLRVDRSEEDDFTLESLATGLNGNDVKSNNNGDSRFPTSNNSRLLIIVFRGGKGGGGEAREKFDICSTLSNE